MHGWKEWPLRRDGQRSTDLRLRRVFRGKRLRGRIELRVWRHLLDLVDTDCGANGFCSPSYGSCGKFGGEYEGVYCHTAKDTCVNDSDCTGGGANGDGPGLCAFDTESNAWACSYTFCAG
jgi:hypothetical protein